ncbi:M48 family metallopeptidase [Teredinibacter turnerae]|uniref:M48 family metallopeptidase n=1 Tax=Teredinibacter turnerae TaxID=2426 RepID=UPI000361CCCE|nr:SprT family zinc-dependent metalloprotease [Teredinibacter turnerae]
MPSTDRSTTDIVIERNGSVVVRPPQHFSEDQVDEVVRSKRMWIYRNLAEWRDLNATAVVREWVNGETFLYSGRSYRLSLVGDQDCDLKLQDGRFCLRRELVDTEGAKGAKQAFEHYFAARGLARIRDRVKYYAPKVGVEPASVVIKEMGYRWANCSKSNALAFHWKCMMAPPQIIDYIVVHELCHIHHRNHSDKFWNEVDKVMPDYRERKNWLRLNGANLDL